MTVESGKLIVCIHPSFRLQFFDCLICHRALGPVQPQIIDPFPHARILHRRMLRQFIARRARLPAVSTMPRRNLPRNRPFQPAGIRLAVRRRNPGLPKFHEIFHRPGFVPVIERADALDILVALAARKRHHSGDFLKNPLSRAGVRDQRPFRILGLL